MEHFRICLFYILLTLCRVQADVMDEEDKTHEISAVTATPLSMQSDQNFILQTKAEQNANIWNEVEVFKENSGAQKENQEEEEPVEEPEVEEEVGPEGEETKGEDEAEEEAKQATEAATGEKEDDVALDGEAVPEAEPIQPSKVEPEIAAVPAPEEPNAEEVPVEPETEQKTESEPASSNEKENIQPDSEQHEAEMPNDEPAKEEGEVVKDKSVISTAKDTNIYCFTCTSNENSSCSKKATQKVSCLQVNKGDAGKHNGCYTLYKADTNMTMRGCVDELAEDGLKYCLKHEELCHLCYSNGCNDKVAPSSATQLKFNTFSLLLFTMASITISDLSSFIFE